MLGGDKLNKKDLTCAMNYTIYALDLGYLCPQTTLPLCQLFVHVCIYITVNNADHMRHRAYVNKH